MRGLTLTQPYASLVAIGEKKIETRSWSTWYRGPIAIHAAKGLSSVGGRRGLDDLVMTSPFREALFDGAAEVDLPLGFIVAVCDLVNVLPTSQFRPAMPELSFGDYSLGRFAWVLGSVRPLSIRIPYRGSLGLWQVPPAVLTLIHYQEDAQG